MIPKNGYNSHFFEDNCILFSLFCFFCVTLHFRKQTDFIINHQYTKELWQ